jgi:cytochrome c oxidase assembly factor CtaG
LTLWICTRPLFVAALGNEAIQVLQHTCFFASALVFWWAAVGCRLRSPNATSIALLFTTMLHTSAWSVTNLLSDTVVRESRARIPPVWRSRTSGSADS